MLFDEKKDITLTVAQFEWKPINIRKKWIHMDKPKLINKLIISPF